MRIKKAKSEYRVPPFSSITEIWIELDGEPKPYKLVPMNEVQHKMADKNWRETRGADHLDRPLHFMPKGNNLVVIFPSPKDDGEANVRFFPPEQEF